MGDDDEFIIIIVIVLAIIRFFSLHNQHLTAPAINQDRVARRRRDLKIANCQSTRANNGAKDGYLHQPQPDSVSRPSSQYE